MNLLLISNCDDYIYFIEWGQYTKKNEVFNYNGHYDPLWMRSYYSGEGLLYNEF